MKYPLLVFMSALLVILFPMVSKAQTTIEGRLVDETSKGLIQATVRCFTDQSVFVCGTKTNDKGEFKLKAPLTNKSMQIKINYIGYEETTLNIDATKESVIRLGDIVMNHKLTQVQEVTVLGSNRVRTEDKTVIYPTKEELRYAYDGYSALGALMIPGLTANSSSGSISYLNQSVLLCIDGRESTQEEVQNLDAKYIKRIDFYNNGRPDYPEATSVINIIMKERDYAGTVAFNGGHHLNLPKGNGRTTAQYFQNKSEFAVSVSGAYTHFKQREEGSATTSYHFPEQTIIRTEGNLPAWKESNNLKTYTNYIYREEGQDFYASMRFNRSLSDNQNLNTTQYSTSPSLQTKQQNTWSRNINPALQLRYNRLLPGNQKLRTELYGSYGNNDYDRYYEFRTNETITDYYRNSTDENSYYAKGRLNYTKTFKNRSSLNVDLMQDFTHTEDHNLRGDKTNRVELDKSNTRLALTYNYRLKNRMNLQLKLANHLANVTTSGRHITNFFFTPSIRLSYNHKRHTFSLKGEAQSSEASISNRTGDEYKINEYETFLGNPDLKDNMKYNATVSYSWEMSKIFSLILYSTYNLITDSRYVDIYYDASKNTFVNQTINRGTSWWQHYEVFMQHNLVPQTFFVRTGVLYNNTKCSVWEDVYNQQLYASFSMTYQNKGFRITTGFLTGSTGMNSSNGYKNRSPCDLYLMVSYHWNSWYANLRYRNPFKARSSGWLRLKDYESSYESRTPRVSDNIATLSFGFRFNFGKKKHKFYNSEVEDVNQSTISK